MQEWDMEPKGDDGPEILSVTVRKCLGEGDVGESYQVGFGGVTRIFQRGLDVGVSMPPSEQK